MTRVLLTAKQQLERVGVARRDALLRKGYSDVRQLPYKPHLRMRASKLRDFLGFEYIGLGIDWLRPYPDGNVRLEPIYGSREDYIPANGWQAVRITVDPSEHYRLRRQLTQRGFLDRYGIRVFDK